MSQDRDTLEAVRHTLRSEPKIGATASGIRPSLESGAVVVEGEVPDIAAKKLALERIACLPDVDGIVDRLRVRPAAVMGDREIALHVRDALLQEPAFAECAVTVLHGGAPEVERDPLDRAGLFEIAVEEGVVTLNGTVTGLARKRLAGVLAWWVPGSRDVINGIAIEPPEEDADDSIAEAVRIVLEKDPFVDAAKIGVAVDFAVVRLTGVVPTESERHMAEYDAWYVFGVDRVISEIDVHA